MKDLTKTISALRKKYNDSIILTGDELSKLKIDKIGTGSVWLDHLLDGGIPKGRVTELYGTPSGGKTLIAMRTVAEAQKKGMSCILFDAERTFNPGYASKLGVDVENLVVVSESAGERVFDMMETLLSDEPDLIVVDSVAALVPVYEEENPVGQQTMALQARLMSKGLRKITGKISKANTAVIFINQLREKPGAYGNPEITSGGRALGFYSSVRIEVRRGDALTPKDLGEVVDDATSEEKQRKIGHVVKFKIAKSKVSMPHTSGSFEFYYEDAYVNLEEELISLLTYEKKIQRRGPYYDVEGIAYLGKAALSKSIREDAKLRAKLIKSLKKK